MYAHVHIFKAKELYRFMYDYVKRIVPYRFGGGVELITIRN